MADPATPMQLSTEAVRVLGSLMEKARTTPEVYPLTLNSLVLACNQKTSREPVTDLDDDEVLGALDELRELGLAIRVDLAGSRTAKFRENVTNKWHLEREASALLAVLFLRGPQTPGQLRQRTERLHAFAELGQVGEWLQRMQEREEEPHSLVVPAGRPAGSKEMRYAHTLCPVPDLPEGEEPAAGGGPEAGAAGSVPGTRERLTQLEEQLREAVARIEKLEQFVHELNS